MHKDELVFGDRVRDIEDGRLAVVVALGYNKTDPMVQVVYHGTVRAVNRNCSALAYAFFNENEDPRPPLADPRNADDAPPRHIFSGSHGECPAVGEHSHVPTSSWPGPDYTIGDLLDGSADQLDMIDRLRDWFPEADDVNTLAIMFWDGTR